MVLEKVPLNLDLQSYSPIYEDLNTLNSKIIESGFPIFYKSLDDHFDNIKQQRSDDNNDDPMQAKPITLERLYLYFVCYFIGILTATIVFIVELLIANVNTIRKMF